MSGTRPVYYWDTCLFLAWIKNEVSRKPGEMDAIADILRRFRKREVSLVTSLITVVEITTAKLPAGTEGMIESVMQSPNFTRAAVEIRVANLARDLRNYYLGRESAGGKTLTVPDSIHVATAIHYRVTEMHTFDGKDNAKFNSLGLLPLSGNVAGHNLKICMPPVPNQSSLPGMAGFNS